VRQELEGRGVELRDAPTRRAATRHAVILVDERTGERMVLWQRDAALALTAEEVRPETIGRARLLHVDATDEEMSIHAAHLGRAAGIPVTSDIDRITDRTADLVRAVTIPIFAEGVAAALTGDASDREAMRSLRRDHGGWLCVTRGARGALLLDGDRLHEAEAFVVDVVDTTGAGDVFRAGFIYALLRGDSPRDVLRFANAAAAVSCTREGAIGSVPTLGEVERLLRMS
jgi:sugar/nucleoside kinase (ribokinase family)